MAAPHEQIRELLALAAADSLPAADRRRVAEHVAGCPECAAEMETWRELVRDLRGLPRPAVPPGLAARTRARILRERAEAAERRFGDAVIAVLVLFAWTLGLSGWTLLRVLAPAWPAALDLSFAGAFAWLAATTVLAWLTAGVAALLLGRRRRLERSCL